MPVKSAATAQLGQHSPVLAVVWLTSVLVVAFGLRDILRADNDSWQDMTVEVQYA